MVEFLIEAVQVTCIIGLLYGAYLCITYGAGYEPAPEPVRFDPVTTHAWMNAPETLRHV